MAQPFQRSIQAVWRRSSIASPNDIHRTSSDMMALM
jgi:hypothetical protein